MHRKSLRIFPKPNLSKNVVAASPAPDFQGNGRADGYLSEVVLHHAALAVVTPAIRRRTASWVASARESSPAILPSRITRIRVERLMHLGQLGGNQNDGESLTCQVVNKGMDCGLCSDIDSAGGFIHDQELSAASEPFGKDDFLLVASAERTWRGFHRGGLYPQLAKIIGRRPPLLSCA